MKVFVFSILLLGYPNFFCDAMRGKNDLVLDIKELPDPMDITTETKDDLTVYKPYEPALLKKVTEGETVVWYKKRGETAEKVVVFQVGGEPSLLYVYFKTGNGDENMHVYAKNGGVWVLRGTYDPNAPGSALSGENYVPEKNVPSLALDVSALSARGTKVHNFVSLNLPARVYNVNPGEVVKSLWVGETVVWKDENSTLKSSKVYEPKGLDGVLFTAVIDDHGSEVTRYFKKDGSGVKELSKKDFESFLKDLVDQDLLDATNAPSGEL